MAKEGRDLVTEAVNDAKALKEAALAAARDQIVEQMAPAIKDLFEKSVKGVLDEKRGLTGRIGMSQRGDYMTPKTQKWEEEKEKGDPKMDKEAPKKEDEKELDLESLASFFPAMTEDPDPDPDADPAAPPPADAKMPTLGEDPDPDADPGMYGEDADPDADPEMDPEMKKEAKKHHKDDEEAEEKAEKEEDKMDEEIEISEAELKKVYEAALQTEVQVKKGFADMTPAGELEDVAKDAGKGLNPEKKGEHHWEEEEPPAKQDFTVKEMIQRGLAENKALKENLKKAVGIIQSLGKKLHEVNLFNAKVLHVNRILNTHGRLTKEQKKVVLESIDKAETISEVKRVYEAISSSFNAAKALSESTARKPTANSQRPRGTGTPNQKVLSESVDHNKEGFSRLQKLAGIVK